MNEEIERLFVNTYIQKQFRERLIFELKDISSKTPKRSFRAFAKLSHAAGDYLIPRLIALSGSHLTGQDVLSFVEKMVRGKSCYYMDDFGGEEMPLNEAVDRAFNDPGASIIVYQDIFAVLKEETFIGAPCKYILVNQR